MLVAPQFSIGPGPPWSSDERASIMKHKPLSHSPTVISLLNLGKGRVGQSAIDRRRQPADDRPVIGGRQLGKLEWPRILTRFMPASPRSPSPFCPPRYSSIRIPPSLAFSPFHPHALFSIRHHAAPLSGSVQARQIFLWQEVFSAAALHPFARDHPRGGP